MKNTDNFTFEISLSVLNHLGRNLYRSFTTVLGEAISNSWDANAENVWLHINKEKNSFFIKDDGDGMTADDFQNKFLKIGYSKRKEGKTSPGKGRPYIGRKGIGKLALLSCAEKISVISKVHAGNYIGGAIDNSGLDKAITDDLTPKEYQLGDLDHSIFTEDTKGHDKGTIVYFENIKEGVKHSLIFLKKTIALYFRFSLVDKNFNIFIDNEPVTHECLDDLASNTEFLWRINNIEDPYIEMLEKKFTEEKNEKRQLEVSGTIKGFIASVKKPRNLTITTMKEERVSIDLFVNGRIRERDILKHMPTARVVENYLYGQVHFDDLNDKDDRFTSSREGIVADDPKFKDLLELLRSEVIFKVIEDWDVWRRKHKKDGDSENPSLSPKDRKAGELYNAVSKEYALPKGSKQKKKVKGWVDDLSEDAQYNFVSYAECFISENLIRKLIHDKKTTLTPEAVIDVTKFKNKERDNKKNGNINIEIRKAGTDASYLDMDGLANLVDKQRGTTNCLSHDAKQYKPTRDALMHTARLTGEAKRKLTTIYDNIKGRIITLLSGG